MKIIYVYDRFPSVYQNYLIQLVESLKKSIDLKTLVYDKNPNSDFSIRSYSFKDSFFRFLYKLKLSKYTSYDISLFNKFDIIHLQHSYLWPKIISILSQQDRPKIVITLRGGDTYLKPLMSDRWSFFYKEYGNKIDAFIVMSQHQKKYLIRWGVPADKISVIPISFGLSSKAHPKYPNPEVLKLVSAFRMTWEKNIEGTLRFAKILKERSIPFQYDIYGDGSDISQLYYFIDRFDLNGFVNVKGKINNDTLRKSLVQYDFFVQLSFSESLGMSVIEAQSVGLPCVISNSGGLPEAVLENETALVGDFNELDTLVGYTVNLWKNKELYYSYSERAIQNANEKFTMDKEIERLSVLYDALMK